MSDHSVRGRGHVALSRHKLGSWNTLLDFLPKEITKNEEVGGDSSGLSHVEQPQDVEGKYFWVVQVQSKVIFDGNRVKP